MLNKNIEYKNRDEISSHIRRNHLLLFPDGKEIKLNIDKSDEVKSILKDIGDNALSSYIQSEEIKGQPKNEPPSIKEMRRLQLVDYEKGSDSGHFRFYPKGYLVSELLKRWADEIALQQLGAMQIESPLIYDWDDLEIKEQAGSFHENHYRVSVPDNPDKHFVMRFAADFGLFKIMKQAKFNYKMLPLRIYEFSKSFRYERRGALSGLKRLRAFQMPDIHCFCKDIGHGWDEYQLLYKKYADLADGIGVPYVIGFRIVKEFYDAHKDKILKLVKYSNKPAYIEIMSEMKHYWVVKHEFQGIDSVGGNVQLSTVQLDIKDSDVYNIKYSDENGDKKGCIICHSSIGSIERWIYSILENAIKMERPCLPLWLSPCQFRIIPVSDKHLGFCKSLKIKNLRYEIDDRNESLGKKIANANMNWIPYVAVIGDKEIESGKVIINNRINLEKNEIFIKNFEKIIQSQISDKPFMHSSMPILLSRHPVFYG